MQRVLFCLGMMVTAVCSAHPFLGAELFGGHAFVGQGIREGAGRKISPDVPAAAWVSGAFRTGAFVGIFWREGRNLKLFRWAGIS